MRPTATTNATCRTDPLSATELWSFYENGFLELGAVLDEATVESLRAVVAQHRSTGADADLLDPAAWPEGDGGVPQEPGRNVSFLFNLWRSEPTVRSVALKSQFARWAQQVLGATRVRLLEDNALTKDPHSGGELKWHQDYAFWPLAQPNAVTVWIALDDVTVDNGAVRMASGSHLLGERLPAAFGTGASYFRDRRPAIIEPVVDPSELGLDVRSMELKAGEATMHHALTWHASGPNATDQPRRAVVFRYVADGTIWFGARRYEFNYTDEELGLEAGDPIGGDFFPVLNDVVDA